MTAHTPITPLAPSALRRFLLAGRTVLTVKNTKRGSHYSYEVRFDGSWPARVFSLGVGGERRVLGLVNARGSFYRVGRSPLAAGSPQDVCFSWLWGRVADERALPSIAEVWHHGCCCRCGRELTDPTSIHRGYGPDCWAVVTSGAALAERLSGVSQRLLDGEDVEGLPAPLAALPAVTVAHLLRLLALDDVDSWMQVRELAMASGIGAAAVDHLDSLIAARISVVCGGSAKKGLAAVTRDAAEVDGWWFRDEVGEMAMLAAK